MVGRRRHLRGALGVYHDSGNVALSLRKGADAAAETVARITTGAGDTYAAGFLGVYHDSGNVALSLRKGADAAAETVARIGAFDAEMTPWA